MLDVVKNVILATDVAAHLRKLDKIKAMVKGVCVCVCE